jgi:competence transcription factor ComK
MKKLLVSYSEVDQDITNNIELYSTMQMSYGRYDFNAEKIVNELCKVFGLTYVGTEATEHILQDKDEKVVRLIFSETYHG